jgi:peptidyl serine alpha-galactosyltransferase
MYRIVVKWCEFVPRVHNQYPHLLAEMFAYSLAAAHLQLYHQTAVSFMLSNPSAFDFNGVYEEWRFVEKLGAERVCSPLSPTDIVPNVVHYCQEYGVGHYYFEKRRMHNDFMSCASPLLVEPPSTLAADFDYRLLPTGEREQLPPGQVLANAFMVCRILPAVNAAMKFRHCSTGDNPPNLTKALLLLPNV